MTYVRWDNTNEKNPQGENFLSWSQEFLDQNFPVIGGFYLQEKNGDRGKCQTSSSSTVVDYDHIMPIIGYETSKSSNSKSQLTNIYYNDLYLNTTRILDLPDDIKTRSECSQKTAPEQPYTYCQPDIVAYGIAITGNMDINAETYPIQLDVGYWTEV